jgi:hypothetical protein
MKTDKYVVNSITIALCMFLLAACGMPKSVSTTLTPTAPPVIPQTAPASSTPLIPSETVSPTETGIPPTETISPSPGPINTITPVSTHTLKPGTPTPQGIPGLTGVWKGQVKGGTESPKVFLSEKVFEIRYCHPDLPCLDVLTGGDFFPFARVPLSSTKEGKYCFTLPAPGQFFYDGCFTLKTDGTLEYQGMGPLWGETGTLTRLSTNQADTLRKSINQSCEKSPAPRIDVGKPARVTHTPDRLPLTARDQPGLKGKKSFTIAEGKQFDVLSGPICQDGYWWWWISYNGSIVSVAEGEPGKYYIEP